MDDAVASDLPEAPLSVGAAAARIGVAASTLRTWQRRYGLAPTVRSRGGHRRYLPQDVAVLQHMHALMLAGIPPAMAATRARADAVPGGEPVPAVGVPAVGVPAVGVPAVGAPAARGRTTRRVLQVPGAPAAARGLARAASRLDADACVQLVETALAADGVERTWDELLRPVLVAAGLNWARTGEGVDIEHLLTDATIEALRVYRRGRPRPDIRPPALLACAPADQHSLPLYVVAAALAEQGHASRVLGTHVPLAALGAALTRTRARSVFLWAQLPDPRNDAVLDGLPALRPRPLVVLGGPGWAPDLPPGVGVAHSLGDAARALLTPGAARN